jgi:hypothetical protein
VYTRCDFMEDEEALQGAEETLQATLKGSGDAEPKVSTGHILFLALCVHLYFCSTVAYCVVLSFSDVIVSSV